MVPLPFCERVIIEFGMWTSVLDVGAHDSPPAGGIGWGGSRGHLPSSRYVTTKDTFS